MNQRLEIADHQPHVLIVDDEPHNRMLLEVILTTEGYAILTAADGAEALAIVSRQPPDLILLDIMMPGMDGYQVARKIKDDPATQGIPIILVTALDDRSARILGLKAGAEEFLTKPVDRVELCMRVRNLLRLKAYGDYHDKYSQMLEGEVGLRAADLVESERLYRSTFDAAPVGIVHVALDGQWLRINPRMGELLGYLPGELQGTGAVGLLQSEGGTGEAEALRLMAAGTLARHVVDEKQYRRKDGTFVWGRINISIHRDTAGHPLHFIFVVEDITERRTLEAQVRQASKMDAIGRLASGVAHDFNNLLMVILGFAQILTEDAAVSEPHGEELSEIIKAAQSAEGLTKQLLAFSRQQVLHAAPIDLNELIKTMVGMLGRLIGAHIEIALTLAPSLSPALADRSQLEQVIMNLVVNARDAMPNGGRVTIETTEVELEDGPFHHEAVMQGHYVMLAVTDTGSGMTRETQRRLFEPFFTTKEIGKGTGLGLSTTYGIVKQSKGYIWVSSELGRGTTFKVYLPCAEGDVQAQALSSVATACAKREAATVLLVEDEPSVRQGSRRILDKSDYRVLAAGSADNAISIFDK